RTHRVWGANWKMDEDRDHFRGRRLPPCHRWKSSCLRRHKTASTSKWFRLPCAWREYRIAGEGPETRSPGEVGGYAGCGRRRLLPALRAVCPRRGVARIGELIDEGFVSAKSWWPIRLRVAPFSPIHLSCRDRSRRKTRHTWNR